MKCSQCRGIIFKLIFLSILLFNIITMQTRMMMIHAYLLNIIFVFLKTKNMIQILSNIVLNCIETTWWMVGMCHNGILFG